MQDFETVDEVEDEDVGYTTGQSGVGGDGSTQAPHVTMRKNKGRSGSPAAVAGAPEGGVVRFTTPAVQVGFSKGAAAHTRGVATTTAGLAADTAAVVGGGNLQPGQGGNNAPDPFTLEAFLFNERLSTDAKDMTDEVDAMGENPKTGVELGEY